MRLKALKEGRIWKKSERSGNVFGQYFKLLKPFIRPYVKDNNVRVAMDPPGAKIIITYNGQDKIFTQKDLDDFLKELSD